MLCSEFKDHEAERGRGVRAGREVALGIILLLWVILWPFASYD